MNRRSFFKTVTGFVAGVCAAFVPKAKSDVIIFPTEKKAREFSRKRIQPKCSDCPDEDGSQFCEDLTCPYCINSYSISSRQEHILGTCLVIKEGFRFRYSKKPIGSKFFGRILTRSIWFWMPESEWIKADPNEGFVELSIP